MSETNRTSKIEELANSFIEKIREIANEEIDKAIKETSDSASVDTDRGVIFTAEMIAPVLDQRKVTIPLRNLRDLVSELLDCMEHGGYRVRIGSDDFPNVSSLRGEQGRADDREVGGLRRTQFGLDLCETFCTHKASPCVAESGAATPGAPAMTVSENTSAGVGTPSAPAHPRFVAIGEYVYDRDRNRVAGGWPANVAAAYAADLNSGAIVASYLNWEDAK